MRAWRQRGEAKKNVGSVRKADTQKKNEPAMRLGLAPHAPGTLAGVGGVLRDFCQSALSSIR